MKLKKKLILATVTFTVAVFAEYKKGDHEKLNHKPKLEMDNNGFYEDTATKTDEFNRTKVVEAVYMNFENCVKKNLELKEKLVKELKGLAEKINSATTEAQIFKYAAAVDILKCRIQILDLQVKQAYQKIVACQIRNDSQKKLGNIIEKEQNSKILNKLQDENTKKLNK